jgi:hypothetical protein
MTQQPPQRDLVSAPSAANPANRDSQGVLQQTQATAEDASLIDLSAMSVSTTFIEGAPHQQRAFATWQETIWRPPVAGVLSVIFAIVAFYHVTLLMAPLAIIAGIVALIQKQKNWAAIGIIAGLVALLSDISFWALIGVTWTVHWLFWG